MLKSFTVLVTTILVLSSFNTHAVGWGDLKKKLMGEDKKTEVKSETVAIESGYPIADVFLNIDPLLAVYGSSVLKLMTGYEFFLKAYGEKELAAKAKALINDLHSGAALDSGMIKRISKTNNELGEKVEALQNENKQLNRSSKKNFVMGLPYFVDGVHQYAVVVDRGTEYVESLKQDAKNADQGSIMDKIGRATSGFIKGNTVVKVSKGAKNDWPLLYKSFSSIYKFCQSNDIPLPDNADDVLKDIEL